MAEVTKADLRDLRDTIVEEMRLGFAGVHRRQDTTNGRVNEAEQDVARHDIRLKNVEREVFQRRATDGGDARDAASELKVAASQMRRAAGTLGTTKLIAAAVAGLAGLAGFNEASHALAAFVKVILGVEAQ